MTRNIRDSVWGTMMGVSKNDILTGRNSDNRIYGDVAADQMAGGAGHDTYVIDKAIDVRIEAANAATDTIEASVDTKLSPNVENLIPAGSKSALVGRRFNGGWRRAA